MIRLNPLRILIQVSDNILRRNIHITPTLKLAKLTPSKENRVKCTLIPGDGVGPEIIHSVEEVFKAAGVPVDFETYFISEVNPAWSAPIDEVIKSINKNKICLKGTLDTPGYSRTGDLQTLNMKLRNQLDLYANVAHLKSLPGVRTKHADVDCIVVREHTEGEYSGLEHESVKGVVESLKIITAIQSNKIAKFAFEYATKNERKKITAVHKANIMKLSDGLFLRSCAATSKRYPKIKFEQVIVDNCAMQMVYKPQQFDILLTTNLYGNIIDNLGAGLVGGAGIVAGASYSANCAVFEPGARHTFAEAVGKNVANPTAMILCSANLLIHVNLASYGEMIKNSVYKILLDGKVRTKDLGGHANTQEFTAAVIQSLTPTSK